MNTNTSIDASSPPILTIDGPSGAGKGTISQCVAQKLGWHILDSGALYRAVGYAMTQAGHDPANETMAVDTARQIHVSFVSKNVYEPVHIYIDGELASEQLRTETVAKAASTVAKYEGVRRALLDKQRQFGKSPGLVADGRDMGTVVFPDAPVKVFLTASPEERAKRRYKQLKEKGLEVKLHTLMEEIKARDVRDTTRAVAPLKPANDALVIDTTSMSIERVVDEVIDLVKAKYPACQV